jgi:hypothetical protein
MPHQSSHELLVKAVKVGGEWQGEVGKAVTARQGAVWLG